MRKKYTATVAPKRTVRINDEIRADEVRVIGKDGEMLGLFSLSDAIEKAFEEELDLIEIVPNAEPPVCKIMSYGQYQYEKKKKEQATRKASKKVEIKGIRLSLKIGSHDLTIRAKSAYKFLMEGDKVKIELQLRGRERGRPDLAEDVFNEFLQEIQNQFTENKQTCTLIKEQNLMLNGNRFSMLILKK